MTQRFRPLAASLRLRTPVSTALPPFAFASSFYSASPAATPSQTAAEASSLSATPPTSETAPPYFVPRTAGGELPVYSDVRNGGSRVYTIVRKTRGDLNALQRDLASYLTDVPSHVKPSAGQVILRGDWVRETKEWLAAKGF
ncbi:hypothetical protein JCM10908_005791 [Rhodotorula pacifica]|uniref:mitochondrial 54S ribosomal protein mL49 IMG2 n=1 Tax=Rhodotorula pacifica TaxID=1495444 RepID=UPI00317FD90A